MRRFVCLAVLLLFTVPFGISISGCAKHSSNITFCNGDSGPLVGQVKSITLSPRVYGVSLNYGLIGQIAAPSAVDCKGNAVSVSSYKYGTTDMTIADVQPTTGRLCAGTWNRNSGAGVADYTICNPTFKSGTAYITASGEGASSNSLPVYVHPTVTNVVLGPPSTDCATDPSTNCSPAAYSTSQTSCTINPANGCCTTPLPTSTAYVSNSCISQGDTGQLAAKVYAGTGATQTNISCRVGHLTYTPQAASIVTIDENGVATAQAPGSTIITANLSNAGSSAGFFSTCPPQSITLSVPNSTSTSVSVNPNNPQPLTAVVRDTNNKILTGLTLEFVSTTPPTIPGNSTITPLFPGTAGITAICQPPSCNPSPFNQIGLYGNGTPIISNEINVTSPGKSSTALYIASTKSQYIVPVDFTTTVIGSPIRLPYVPNSMVISNDGSTIYMGSDTELMTFNALTNSLASQDPTIMGKVLAVSPDNTTLVVTDPSRQLIYLYSAGGGSSTTSAIQSQIGGTGTRAEFSPDSQTVYVTTTTNQLLVHSALTGWTTAPLSTPATDVAVTVPSAGAFLAGDTTTARSQCPITSTTTVNGLPTTTNQFYPDAGVVAPKTDRIVATNDGIHILGATVTPAATLTDLVLSHSDAATSSTQPGVPIGKCPATGQQFTAAPVLTSALPGVTATSITGVVPASDSSIAFVTYLGSGSVLPTYTPQANGPGTLGNIQLSGTAVAPVAGVISSDNSTFYIGTSGDNAVHLIDRSTLKDDPTKTIAPKLPDASGNPAVPDLLVQRPRKSIS
jgi:hypothetical protein